MAIWQVAINVISKEKIIKYSDEKFQSSLKNLETTFLKENSWSKTIIQYGNLDSTCIEISLYNDIIDEISVRVDLQTISKEQLLIICNFINENNFLIEYDGEKNKANIDNFVKIFKKSGAYRFLTDPQQYLSQIS